MHNLSQTRLRIAAILIVAFIGQAAVASDHIFIDVAPNDNLGAGFGELSPGFHDLRVTLTASGWELYIMSADDFTGMTTWDVESSTGSSVTLVSYGAQEDNMGAVYIEGELMDPSDPAMLESCFVGIANALWPCATCELDEFGMPLCQAPNNEMGDCDTAEEGWRNITVPGDKMVSVGIGHTASGTLTILGATSDLEILNPDETPFTSAYVTGSGGTLVPILIRAKETFSGEVTLIARFLQDNAQLDTQDLLVVKEFIPLKLVSLDPADHLVLGNDLEIEYEVETGANFNDIALEIRNSEDVLVYRVTGLDTDPGTHETEWPSGKWNQQPHNGAYANPHKGEYDVQVIGSGAGGDVPSNVLSIDTKLVLRFTVRDKNPAGTNPSRVAGVDDVADALRVQMKRTGAGVEADISGVGISSEDGPNNNPPLDYQQVVTVDHQDLNALPSGKYSVALLSFRDAVGNFDTATASNNLELW